MTVRQLYGWKMCLTMWQVAYVLFTELDFFNTFHIPVRQFVAYFHALELGYRQNPCKSSSHVRCSCYRHLETTCILCDRGHTTRRYPIRSAKRIGSGRCTTYHVYTTVMGKSQIKSRCQITNLQTKKRQITNRISNHTPKLQIILAQISNHIASQF